MGIITNRFASVFAIVLATGVLLALEPADARDASSQELSAQDSLAQDSSAQEMPAQDEMSVQAELERLAAEFKAHSDRAIDAAAQAAQRAVEDNADALSDAQAEWTAQLESFRALLNDQKAYLDRMTEDAAASLDIWTKAAKDSWENSWEEMHKSAQDALDLLQDWLDRQSASPEAIPV